VIAVGAPLGLSGTVTSGIVSAMDRTVEVPAEDDHSALLVSALQTDAAINPGNSGGALVNCSGDLIGVPTAGATVPTADGGSSAGSVGLGFAIPVNIAKTISDEIISTGRVSHSYFGVQTLPIPADAAAQAGLKGGLFVAGSLGYALAVKNLLVVNVEFYDGVGSTLAMPVMLPPVPSAVDFSAKKVLIADDVADSGRTLELVYTFLKDQVEDVRSAVIYEKPRSLIKCDYVWRRTDLWINFPWSNEDPVVHRAGQVLDA